MTSNLIPQFKNLLHTDPSCPMCGCNLTPAQKGIIGINNTVCLSCAENMHIYNPRYATLYTDQDGSIEIWDYIPQSKSWRQKDLKHLIFLNPDIPTDCLCEQTQQSIVDFVENNTEELPPQVNRKEVDSTYLDIILRDKVPQGDLSKSQKRTLRSKIETPTIVTPSYVFSPNVESLTDTPEIVTTKDKNKQLTFAEL